MKDAEKGRGEILISKERQFALQKNEKGLQGHTGSLDPRFPDFMFVPNLDSYTSRLLFLLNAIGKDGHLFRSSFISIASPPPLILMGQFPAWSQGHTPSLFGLI